MSTIDYEGDRRHIIQRAGEEAALKAEMAAKDQPIEKTYDARVSATNKQSFEERMFWAMNEQLAATREQTAALKEIAQVLRVINENGGRRNGTY